MRALPSVDRVLRELGAVDLPRPAVVAVVRRELAAERRSRRPDASGLVPRIELALAELRRGRLRPVINGTGIIVHTNLGRSPLAPEAVEAVRRAAAGYTNLEFELSSGRRGGRGAYLEHNVALLSHAEAAAVVNNCAAALVLILRHFASAPPRQEVVISRGELVQIGGGFRVPDILQASGATLREVGTTNRTSLADYSRAIAGKTAMVLRVHRSNFFMDGFVESPARDELVALCRKRRVPFVEDLGSGAFFDTGSLAGEAGGGEHEPTPPESMRAGADVVCFSGDKLLGGPQAGIIAGKARHVAALKKDPFFRVLRCDKIAIAAMEATVDLHLSGRAAEIPIFAMMRTGVDGLRARAAGLVESLAGLPVRAGVGSGAAQIGGGSLPRTTIPSATLDLLPDRMPLPELSAALRRADPPVIGYVAARRFKLDLRTVFPGQDPQLLAAIRGVFAG